MLMSQRENRLIKQVLTAFRVTGALVADIHGDYPSVVGLPITKLIRYYANWKCSYEAKV